MMKSPGGLARINARSRHAAAQGCAATTLPVLQDGYVTDDENAFRDALVAFAEKYAKH